MKQRVIKALSVVIVSLVGVLPSSGFAREPSVHADDGAGWGTVYRFRPLDERRVSGQALAVPAGVYASDADRQWLVQGGWRFRPLRTQTERQAAMASIPRVVESPWIPATGRSVMEEQPWADSLFQASRAVKPEASSDIHAARPAVSDRHADVYVMFRGTRYRFRAPRLRIGGEGPALDPTSSYLGEDTLFAGQDWAQPTVHADEFQERGGIKAPVILTPN